jgi:hypothetical protein
MIYDSLERELEALCQQWGIEMTSTMPSGFKKYCKEHPDFTTKQLAHSYQVSDGTILNWKHNVGVQTHFRMDYDRMDSMIRLGKPSTEIMACVGCVMSTVTARRRKLGLATGKKRNMPSKYDGDTADETKGIPVKPFPVLLEENLKRKARRLNMPLPWMRDVWLPGQAGRQMVAEMVAYG